MTINKDNYIQGTISKRIIILFAFVFSFSAMAAADKKLCSAEYQKNIKALIANDKEESTKLAEFSLSKTLQKLAYAHHLLQDEEKEAMKFKSQMRSLFKDNPKKAELANNLESFKNKFQNQKTINDPTSRYTEFYKDSYFNALTEYAKENPNIETELKLTNFEIETLQSLNFHEGDESKTRDIWKTFVSDIAHNYYRRKFSDESGTQLDIDKKFLEGKIKSYNNDFNDTIKGIVDKHRKNANLMSSECYELLKTLHTDSTTPCNLYNPFMLEDSDLTLNIDSIIDELKNKGLASVELQNIRYKGATFEASCKAKSYDPETGIAQIEMDMDFSNIPYFENGNAWKVGVNNSQFIEIESNKHSADFKETGLTSHKFSQKSFSYQVNLTQAQIDSDEKLKLDFQGPKDIKMFQPGAGSTRIGDGNSFNQACDFSKIKTVEPAQVESYKIVLNQTEDATKTIVTITAAVSPETDKFDMSKLNWSLNNASEAVTNNSLEVKKTAQKQVLIVTHEDPLLEKAEIEIAALVEGQQPATEPTLTLTVVKNEDDKATLEAKVTNERDGATLEIKCDTGGCKRTGNKVEVTKGDKKIVVTATYKGSDGTVLKTATASVDKLKEEDEEKEDDEEECKDDDPFDGKDSCAEKEEEKAPIEKTYMPPMQQPLILPSAPSYISPGFN